jgi:hypothetical protein
LWRAADELLCQRLPAGHLPVRLVGMGVTGLDDTGRVRGMLFDQIGKSRVNSTPWPTRSRSDSGWSRCGGEAAFAAKRRKRCSVDSDELEQITTLGSPGDQRAATTLWRASTAVARAELVMLLLAEMVRRQAAQSGNTHQRGSNICYLFVTSSPRRKRKRTHGHSP